MNELVVNFKLSRKAFDLDVNFSIPNQGITALLGPSGSGKSTILRILAGLETPQYGRVINADTVWFDSRKNINVPPQKRNIGVVFQDYALFSHLTVAQNVAYGLSKRDAQEKLNLWLDRLHIWEYRDRFPHQLSGGQRQRVAIARAMATEPDLLLLDEPFSALDVNLRQYLRDELNTIIQEINCPVVLVTHDLNDARFLADRVGVLVNGRLHRYGVTENVFVNPETYEAAKILGWQNFLPVKENYGYCVKGAWGSIELIEEASPDTDYIAIRSEHIRFATSDQKNNIPAIIESITDLGAVRAIKCRLEDSSYIYIQYAWDKPVPTSGALVRLHLAPQYIRLLGERAFNRKSVMFNTDYPATGTV